MMSKKNQISTNETIHILFVAKYDELMQSICDINKVKPAYQNKNTTDFLKDNRSSGFLIPVQITLNKLSTGSGKDDNRAMPKAINYKQ